MLSKQNLIHIATDVVLISVLFMYINNKTKAAKDETEELRSYTEEQIDNVNTKIDNLIKIITRQNQTIKELQQRQKTVTIHSDSPIQPTSTSTSTPTSSPTPTFNPKHSHTPNTPHPPSPHPNIKLQPPKTPRLQPRRVNFQDTMTQSVTQLNNNIDNILNTMSATPIIISASTMNHHPQQSTKIEVINEEEDNEDIDETLDEEGEGVSSIAEEDLNDLEMQEIENALGEDFHNIE